MRTQYQNIPVKSETYQKVKLIAEANGFGLGAQVESWVARELPQCEHPKTAVDIQIFPNQDDLVGGERLHRTGWFCATCNKVYQRLEKLERLELAVEPDPYVQAISSTNKIRSAIRKAEARRLAGKPIKTKKHPSTALRTDSGGNS